MNEDAYVPFDILMVKNLIRYWRNERDSCGYQSEGYLVARCYVDAYQTMLVNHGYNRLPIEREDS